MFDDSGDINRWLMQQEGESRSGSFRVKNLKTNGRGTGSFPCQECPKTFTSNQGLRYHMAKHTGRFNFWCTRCQRGFTMKGQFEAHQAKHDGRTFPCEYCSKRFQSPASLKNHVKTSHVTA